MKVIERNSSAELCIRNSRFLAECFAVSTQEEARALLKSLKELYQDSSHVVHAFVIGPTGEILGCSDDGEPSGTAGRPVLDVLKGSGITNVLLTVARWFGGTELGTGGLVKAYGASAKAVLADAPVRELFECCLFSVSLPYEVYDRFRREADSRKFEVTGEKFGTGIDISGRIRKSLAPEFCAYITDLTSGRSNAVLSEDSRKEPLT